MIALRFADQCYADGAVNTVFIITFRVLRFHSYLAGNVRVPERDMNGAIKVCSGPIAENRTNITQKSTQPILKARCFTVFDDEVLRK